MQLNYFIYQFVHSLNKPRLNISLQVGWSGGITIRMNKMAILHIFFHCSVLRKVIIGRLATPRVCIKVLYTIAHPQFY